MAFALASRGRLNNVRILYAVLFVIASAIVCVAHADASCVDMANETANLANDQKNMMAASLSGLPVVQYRNAAYLQFEKLQLENCGEPAYVAHAMAVGAIMEDELGSEDYATALAFPNSDLDCKAFALVLFDYRIATAWTELHYAYNHGYRGEDFVQARILEADIASKADMSLPPYTVSITSAASFKSHYNIVRHHAIDITPGACGMQREVDDTAP